MKISKPKENQILLEDDSLIDFDLAVKSKTGLKDSIYNQAYNGLILGYRQTGMEASKQIFIGNEISILTLTASLIENMFRYNLLKESDVIKLIKECSHNARKYK